MTSSHTEIVACAACKEDVPQGFVCPACGAGRSPTDVELVDWVQGLISALELSGVTRAQGDEWIDPSYLAALKKRLCAESVTNEVRP